MGRLRERYTDDESFLEAMRGALHHAVNGHDDWRSTVARQIDGMMSSLAMVEAAVRRLPNSEELLEILRSRCPTRERLEETLPHAFIEESPGVPSWAPSERWPTWVEERESSMTPGYSFTVEPRWDHDDVAEYCPLRRAEESHRRILLRWLAHEWAVGRHVSARAALLRTYQPLLQAVRQEYRQSGEEALGDEYDARSSEYLAAALEQAVDAFDFFFKRYDPVLKLTYDEEMKAHRKLGHVTSELELPIGHYLQRKLIEAIRGLVGLEQRNPNRVRGPFRVQDREIVVFLLDDAAEFLEISPSQVRRRIAKGHLLAWKPSAFRARFGLSAAEELILVSAHGTVSVTGHDYWIIDAESAVALKGQRNPEGKYEIGRRGRPRKAHVGPAPGPRAAPQGLPTEPVLPQARLVRPGERVAWPAIVIDSAPNDEGEDEK